MNFDEMDLEPNRVPPAGRVESSTALELPSKEDEAEDEGLQTELLKRTVPLENGAIGYVFTCTKNGAIATWRCHVCNFVDTWKRLKAHLNIQSHEDNMCKYRHSRSNFTKVENIIADFSIGQPLPPGMEDEMTITWPCLISKSLRTFERPLIGLEFLLELRNLVELTEPRYLCLLCDKRGDPRSIFVHLTSQNHYIQYLKKYFRKFYSLIAELPKSNGCRANVFSVTSHLIAKLEEKYGRLEPTMTQEDVVNSPKQRSSLLRSIHSTGHFSESPEDAILEGMLTDEYVQNPQLLLKNFPLKPKHVNTEVPKETPKSLFNKCSKTPSKKNIRGNAEKAHSKSPDDVVFVGCTKSVPAKNGHRSRERSPLPSKDRSLRRSRDRSRRRSRDRSLRKSRDRSLRRSRDRSFRESRDKMLRRSRDSSPRGSGDRSMRRVGDSPFRRSRERSSLRATDRSPLRVGERSPPVRGAKRSPLRGRSPFRARERSPSRLRSRSRHRSPSAERGRRRYVSPSYYRTLRYRLSRSRSPRRRSRSPIVERIYRRPPSPLDRRRERSPRSSRYASHRDRSPEREIRRVIVHRSPSPSSRGSDYAAKYRKRSSREGSPLVRAPRSRSRSRPRREANVDSGSQASASVDDSSKIKPEERSELESNDAYVKEVRDLEKRLNKDMDGYMETPESHPAYQNEWKKYWYAKFKEVRKKGKEDPLKYDYKPEWVVFWNKRVNELFDQELKSKINALKDEYRISDCKKKEEPVERVPSKSPKEDNKPVHDIKTMWKELTGCDIKDDTTAAKQRSVSPWEEDDLATDKDASKGAKNGNSLNDDGAQSVSADSLSPISDAESPQRNPFCRSRSRSKSLSRSAIRSVSDEYPFKNDYPKLPSKKIHFDNPLNVITVLRQLSVLEFQLGSHASHVISLLTSGLTMERIKPQSSIDLLTEENILFLELVKEKLKGQLLAGIVPKAMVKAALFGIKNIEELLDVISKVKPIAPPPIPVPPAALLYGVGADQMRAASLFGFGSHVYGQPFSDYHKSFRHFDRGGNRRREHNPFSKTSPKRKDVGATDLNHRISDEFPFRNDDVAAEAKPSAAVKEIPIDKNLIALQIAEILTQQGRSDVSNVELQTLINTVVENLKQEQEKRATRKDAPAQSGDATVSAIMNALAAITTAPNANADKTAPSLNTQPAIPADFNVNDISSKTLAMLQDAYANASAVPSANKLFAIEELTEADIIEMLRNFKNIPRTKQEKLIEYLRKLEATDPERVEELKKYVNVL